AAQQQLPPVSSIVSTTPTTSAGAIAGAIATGTTMRVPEYAGGLVAYGQFDPNPHHSHHSHPTYGRPLAPVPPPSAQASATAEPTFSRSRIPQAAATSMRGSQAMPLSGTMALPLTSPPPVHPAGLPAQQQQQHLQDAAMKREPEQVGPVQGDAAQSDSKGSLMASLEGIEVKTKFPVARIKRIMQADEDVGKVAQATPVAVSKALELFMMTLVTKAAAEAAQRNSKRVTAGHLKAAVQRDEVFDFLADIIKKVPDPMQPARRDTLEGSSGGTSGSAATTSATATATSTEPSTSTGTGTGTGTGPDTDESRSSAAGRRSTGRARAASRRGLE
ncbi:hypothetical protein KEM52_005416, partial [Ascosphaera acerosa]